MDQDKNDTCEEVCINASIVEEVNGKMMENETHQNLASLFKTLGDHTRIRIINALYHSELCVCDITAILNMNQSAVSHQLRVLRAAKIVRYRKEGKNVYYSLDDEHIYNLVSLGLKHVSE
jgi:ArsR family transcriptional regulator